MNDSKAPHVLAVVGSFTGLAALSVILRTYVRARIVRRFGIDDYIILLALVHYIHILHLRFLFSYLLTVFVPQGLFIRSTRVFLLVNHIMDWAGTPNSSARRTKRSYTSITTSIQSL